MKPRVINLDWPNQSDLFNEGRILLDIHVPETDAGDWGKVLEFIKSGPYDARLLLDDISISLPQDVSTLFRNTEDVFEAHLFFQVAGVLFACHFFEITDIEFDFPDKINEAQLRAVLNFMADLGDIVNKPVVMTPELMEERVMFRYNPADGHMNFDPQGIFH